MDLEALIRVAPEDRTGTKRPGDVICIKLAGSPWGRLERRFHLVVQWEDRFDSPLGPPGAIARELQRQVDTGERYPVVSRPYHDDQSGLQSTVGLDLDSLPDDVRDKALNRDQDVGILQITLIRGGLSTRSA